LNEAIPSPSMMSGMKTGQAKKFKPFKLYNKSSRVNKLEQIDRHASEGQVYINLEGNAT